MDGLQPVDLAAFAIIAVFAVIGLWRGISGELANLCGSVAALAAGLPVHRFAASFVEEYKLVQPGAAERIAAWGATFAICLIVFGIMYRLVARFVSFLVPQPTNGIMGIAVGVAKGAVICGIALGFARVTGIDLGMERASRPLKAIESCALRYADLSVGK